MGKHLSIGNNSPKHCGQASKQPASQPSLISQYILKLKSGWPCEQAFSEIFPKIKQ